jgi:uncharacterized DUF497 family protein
VWREHAHRLPVDVVDQRGGKQQSADPPAHISDNSSWRKAVQCHGSALNTGHCRRQPALAIQPSRSYNFVLHLKCEMDIEFTWDRGKAKRNLQKHGISFETAKQVFFDPHLIVVEDCEGDDEMRYQAIGHAGSDLLLVVHVDRSEDDQEIVHIVSARRATAYEQAAYSDQFA